MNLRNGRGRYARWLSCLLVALPFWVGCAGTGTSFVHPTVDFSHVRRCAILPYENLTSDGFADERLRSIFLMEILRRGSLEIIDPEETVSVMKDQKIALGSPLTPEQIVTLGDQLCHRFRHRHHILAGIDPAYEDNHRTLGRDAEALQKPGPVAVFGMEELLVDAAP